MCMYMHTLTPQTHEFFPHGRVVHTYIMNTYIHTHNHTHIQGTSVRTAFPYIHAYIHTHTHTCRYRHAHGFFFTHERMFGILLPSAHTCAHRNTYIHTGHVLAFATNFSTNPFLHVKASVIVLHTYIHTSMAMFNVSASIPSCT